VLDAGQTVLSNLDRIMSACDSWMTYNAALGQWAIVINKAETAAYAFNDNNIIGEIRVSATDITSSINQVEARFPFKENRDQAQFVNIKTPDGLRYPNEPDNKYSITYDLVNDSVQTGYLANRLLEQAREDLIVSFSTTYYGIQVDAGNVVSVTNADYGWSAKLFRVMKVNEASLPDGSLGAKLELSEYNAQIYDDLDITAFTPVPNSGLASPTYFSALTAPTVTGYPSATVPNFSVAVAIPATGRVTFGNLFYTTSATPAAADWKLLANAATANSQPVVNSTTYTYANLTLGAGTYYFAYLVGNDISQSALSPISTAFVWTPVAGTGPAGENGLTAINGYKVQGQATAAPTFTTPTTGSALPTGWYGSLTLALAALSPPQTVVAVGQVVWYIQGQYNSNATTLGGVPANKTAWTGPIAASVFQDIRSDNWDGDTPPDIEDPLTYGTEGYYIQQETGDVYFNNGIFRGNISGASGTFSGDLITTGKLSLTGSGNVISGYSVSQYIYSSASYACIYANNTANASVATFYTGNARTIYAQNTSTFSGNPSIYGDNLGNGAGVQATSNTGTALIAYSSTGDAFACQGDMTMSSTTQVTNLNANYLQGNLASAFATSASGTAAYSANRLDGSAGLNVLRFVKGTTTGAAVAGFVSTNKPGLTNTNNEWIEITIDSTTLFIPVWT
jgi:hypothetical protein